MTAAARPAFYALRSGGWRDYVTLLHPPYTLWHLSYVAIGAGLAPKFDWAKLGLTLAAFFLAVGVGAHALDELMGRPLQTQIPRRTLAALAVSSIGVAVAIGVAGAVRYDLWLLAFVAFGAFIVVVYNLELLGGRFHDAIWFAVAWGAFPALTGYFAVAGRLRVEAFLAAGYAFALSLAQQRLSTVVRMVRRRLTSVSGTIELADGTSEQIDADTLIRAPERALQLLAAATTALGLALVLVHV
ncbi:MAG: UbiA prenyltransferase family protein [Actinobacteria bacterium]|nr:UbiA prenyltransferase family protein [Actinomycetota bacterium]